MMINELRRITKDNWNWKVNIDNVASKLNSNYSIEIKAKVLWLFGKTGLKYPVEIEVYVNDIAS